MVSKGWESAGYVEGKQWEIKKRPRYVLMRPVGDYNSDDPHSRVDLDSNGNPDWSTFHSNFDGYFGMLEVFRTAITMALG